MRIEFINGINPFSKFHYCCTVGEIDNDEIPHVANQIKTLLSSSGVINTNVTIKDEKIIVENIDHKAIEFIVECYKKNIDVNRTTLKSLLEKDYLDSTGWTTRLILRELEKKGIPWDILGSPFLPIYNLDNENFVYYYFVLGHGKNQKRLQQSILSSTTDHGVQIASNKYICKRMLQNIGIPTPKGELIHKSSDAVLFFKGTKNNAVVIKPNQYGGGVDCFTELRSIKEIEKKFQICKKNHSSVIIEEYISGKDYRVCVVNYKAIASLSRHQPEITGDGTNTIEQLIIEYEKSIKVNPACRDHVTTDDSFDKKLMEYKVGLKTILPAGIKLVLNQKTNISIGGTATDETDNIPDTIKTYAETICMHLQLNIATVDFILDKKNVAYVLEVNACPGLDNHLFPNKGKPRNVAKSIADLAFDKNDYGRIPLIYVNDENRLFSQYKEQGHRNVLLALQNPKYEWLVFHSKDFWHKGLPVRDLDIAVFYNKKDIDLINYLPTNTKVVLFSITLYTRLIPFLKGISHDRIYIIHNKNIISPEKKILFPFKSDECILKIIDTESLKSSSTNITINLPLRNEHE